MAANPPTRGEGRGGTERGRQVRNPTGFPPHAHHRQTSIVNGVQHSRSGSYNNDGPMQISLSRLENMQTMAIDIPQIPESPTTTIAASASSFSGTGSTLVYNSERQYGHKVNKSFSSHHTGSSSSHNHGASHSSHSLPTPDTSKSPAEYALHMLFTQFVAKADKIINSCIPPNHGMEIEPFLERICGPGVDPTFDKLLNSLGSLMKHKPKPLIDSVMYWRKMKSEAARRARDEVIQATGNQNFQAQISRRNGDPAAYQPAPSTPAVVALMETSAIADRNAIVSIYILCRCLIEIIGQTTLEALTPDMADKLQDIVFSQISDCDPRALMSSPLKLSNWTVCAELLGVMGNINFMKVTDTFFFSLEQHQNKPNAEEEGKMEYVIRAFGYLQLKLYPERALSESAEFVLSLANFFAKSRGQGIKHAYCEVFTKLLLPIAGIATSELNHPSWTEFVSTLYEPLAQMAAKPKHWYTAFPLMATLLCVAPADVFSQGWMPLIEANVIKLRDKSRSGKVLMLEAMARLIWVFLFRCPAETLNATTRCLETMIRHLFPPSTPKKKEAPLIIGDKTVVDPGIEILRTIGFKHQDLIFRTVIFPLLNAEALSPNAGVTPGLEALSPERMMIGIKAFLTIMADLETGQPPPFPQAFASNQFRIGTIVDSGGKAPPRPDKSRISQAVDVRKLGDTAKEYLERFSEILGKIISICDNHFGGQAVIDERPFTPVQPRTPVANTFSFSSKEDMPTAAEQKRNFMNLLHVAIQALPRCMPSNIPFPKVVNVLCTGTAHVEREIAEASANALKSIARQQSAQQVIMGFSRFIFTSDERHTTTNEGGMLGLRNIESTLDLYVELLKIWLENVKAKAKAHKLNGSAGTHGPLSPDENAPKEESSNFDKAYIEELESNGLFFLCNQSRIVRRFAITVLKLITEFDAALDEPDSSRIIHILQQDSLEILDINDDNLPAAERSRLHREMKINKNKGALVDMASSDVQYEESLWFKVFPRFIKSCFEKCPTTVAICREAISVRLMQMYHTTIAPMGEPTAARQGPDGTVRMVPRKPSFAQNKMIEQWKLYLIVACSTMTSMGERVRQQEPRLPAHTRKPSKNQGILAQAHDRLTNARGLFQLIIPLLEFDNEAIRSSVVIGLGSINIALYKILIETFQSGTVIRWTDGGRAPLTRTTTAINSAASRGRDRSRDRLRAEVTHIFQLTSHFLQEAEIFQDDWIMQHIVDIVIETKTFLTEPDVQNDWEHQPLRRYFCGLVEELYEGILKSGRTNWLAFEERLEIFTLVEEWCGFGPKAAAFKEREDNMISKIKQGQQRMGQGLPNTSNLEIERRNLRLASLSAMAALCAGPVSHPIEDQPTHFDVDVVFLWIQSIFTSPSASDRYHRIGKKALKSLLIHNQHNAGMLHTAIRTCYLLSGVDKTTAKAGQSFFTAVSEVLEEIPESYYGYWKAFALCLFKAGDDLLDVRMKAVNLLRVMELRLYQVCKAQEFEVSISDKTAAVYKRAQFELSRALAKQHPHESTVIISELIMFFSQVEQKAQRDILTVLLPWLRTVELAVDPEGDPTPNSYMVLANLFEITVRFSNKIHSEVENLWVALATAPYKANVTVILEFIIRQSLERREPNFVEFCKQIVVFLATTEEGSRLVEALIGYLEPGLTAPVHRPKSKTPQQELFPYLADISKVVPEGAPQMVFSYGHLALVLLVDLLVGSVPQMLDELPLLLQNVFVHWDSPIALVQEQAKEMLIHLIHELIIPTMGKNLGDLERGIIRQFIDTIRQKDPKTCWNYEEQLAPSDGDGMRVPTPMEYIVSVVMEIFEPICHGLKESWGRIALYWATNLPVLQLACRSFQVFRCLLTRVDESMLSDMLSRLAGSIASNTTPNTDSQLFSLEILITLDTIVSELDAENVIQFPQIFWAAVACLNTVHEREFMEVLRLLDHLLDKWDLSDPAHTEFLWQAFPREKWEGDFDGIQELLVKGLRSSVTCGRTLDLFDKLMAIPSCSLIGGDKRLLFSLLANLPRFLEALEAEDLPNDAVTTAHILANAAGEEYKLIHRVVNLFAKGVFTKPKAKQFLTQAVNAIRETFFPDYEADALIFLVGLLFNALPWVKVKTMKLLIELVPHIDMRKASFQGIGADVISPLLRLLQTEYCQQALEVLDKTIAISGGPVDKHVVRMSMGNRQVRKEYERTETLFGIPDDSGWSVPMPAINAAHTRSNVNAVYQSCQAPGAQGDTPIEQVQFQPEHYTYSTIFDDVETMLSDDMSAHRDLRLEQLNTPFAEVDDFDFGNTGVDMDDGGGNLDAILAKLDSLDAFFSEKTKALGGDFSADEDDENTTEKAFNMERSRSKPTIELETGETEPHQIYDNRAYAILNRSLGRNPSISSFATNESYADSLTAPLAPYSAGMWTPTALSAPPLPNFNYGSPRGTPAIGVHRVGEEQQSDDDAFDMDDQSDGLSGVGSPPADLTAKRSGFRAYMPVSPRNRSYRQQYSGLGPRQGQGYNGE